MGLEEKLTVNKPYIGITGAISKEHVLDLISSFNGNGINMCSDVVPMLGFLVSYKVLDSGSNPNDKRYLALSAISGLLEVSRDKAFSTIHYNTKRLESLYNEVSKIMEMDGICANNPELGLQLNVVWPLSSEVEKIRVAYPRLKIILQLNKKMMDSGTVDEVVERLVKEYSKMEYLLIDPSGGTGAEFDQGLSIEIYDSLIKHGFNGIIGFAGGLGGENSETTIRNIKNKLGDVTFSVDAEGRLRDKLSEMPKDTILDIDKARSYIEGSARAYLNKL